MMNTRALYGVTLALAGAAGFSTGWSVKPVVERPVVSFVDRNLMEFEQGWRMTPEERESLRAILRDFDGELDSLRREFDGKYKDQVDAVKDRYDARIRAILTADKRR